MNIENFSNSGQEISSRNTERYTDIKPKSDITRKEADSFWDSEMRDNYNGERENSSVEYIGDQKVYLDDDGVEYRVGNELKPNTTFRINDYTYKTDSNGRVTQAEGQLQIKNHDGRSTMDPRSVVDKGDMKATDNRGHLIADRFNGSGGLENLVPMDSKLNQGDFAKMENKLADAVQNGKTVDYKIDVKYNENSARPSEFRVTYSINGEKDVVVFKNGSGGAS